MNATVLLVVIFMGLAVASVESAASPKKAKIVIVKNELNGILSALQVYELENGDYPSASQGLLALVERPVGKPEALSWQEGGYLDRVPKDPWGRDYIYRNPGHVDPVEVYTLGADGKPGGSGECADIYSSSFQNADSSKCKPQESRKNIFNLIFTGIALLVLGLIVAYLVRKLFKSVDGNIYEFIARLFFWFVGIAFVLLVFKPNIY